MNENKQFKEVKETKSSKTKVINLRVTDEEKKAIEELAEKSHISLSKLLIDTVANQKKLHNEYSVEIAEKLCDLAYEIEYVVVNHPSLKESLGDIREEVVDLWHMLRK